MESRIKDALKLKFEPVAILWSDERPEGATQFKEGRWGCVMWSFASAAKGKTAVFDRNTYGCWGGGVGLGFGNQYLHFPGGIECFYYFLSSGNKNWSKGMAVADQMRQHVRKDFIDDFLEGERYLKSTEDVRSFVEQLPIMDVPTRFVIMKPLSQVKEDRETPVVVVFAVNPDQLSALVTLINFTLKGFNNVVVPWGAACQSIGIYAYREARSDSPKAVLGLFDLSARRNIRNQLGRDMLTFTVPFSVFKEMESGVEGSFLERPVWQELVKG